MANAATAQVGIVLAGMALLALAPPARGTMLLVPASAATPVAAIAVRAGAAIVGRGRVPGSILVQARLAAVAGPLLSHGIVPLAARRALCGEGARP